MRSVSPSPRLHLRGWLVNDQEQNPEASKEDAAQDAAQGAAQGAAQDAGQPAEQAAGQDVSQEWSQAAFLEGVVPRKQPRRGAPPGHQRALKHGGQVARTAITKGTEFTGLAALAERQVKAELEAPGGRRALVLKGAGRLEAAARLYWDALLAAGEQGDRDKMTLYVKVFGWLQGASIRALEAVDRIQDDAPKSLDDLLGKGETDGD